MAAATKPAVYFVGDEDQSIYESLGATTKTPEQIASEFGLDEIEHFTLHGNYRSTQRIIDLYRQLRPNVPAIEGRAKYAGERGLITFDDQTIPREHLPAAIASRVAEALRQGVRAEDIAQLPSVDPKGKNRL